MKKKEIREIIKEEARKLISLLEADPASAGEEAKKRGLVHKGWGRYADKSGRIVAKSVGGKLHALKRAEKPEGEKEPRKPEEKKMSDRAYKKARMDLALQDVTRKAEEYDGELAGGDAKSGFVFLFPDKESAEQFQGAETPFEEPEKTPELRPVKYKGDVKYAVRIKGKHMQPTVEPPKPGEEAEAEYDRQTAQGGRPEVEPIKRRK